MTNYTRYAPHVKRESIANARTALLGKNGFCHEIATQGHSFCTQLQVDKEYHITM